MQFIYLMGVVLIYLVVLIVSYFSKSHLKTKENKYYSILLIINFIGLLLEILCGILGNKLPDDAIICHFFTKLFMCFMTYFTLTLTIYIYSLCFEKNENVFNRIKNLTCIVGMLSTFIIFVLPITTGNGFATGLSCDYTYNVGTVAITASIITIFCHIKNVKMKKVLPFLAFTLFNIIIVFIQRINPTVTLTTSMESIVLFIMYFTIENPDLKIIEELTKTQAMTEASNAEKNKFIFSITNDIQDKIDKLDKLYNTDVLVVKCNLAKEEEIDNMLRIIYDRYDKIDILINNAATTCDTLFEDKTKDNFMNTLDINLVAPFLLCQKIGPKMKENGYGVIINISSTNGIDTPYIESVDYDASKAGLISLSNNLANYLAPYVRVNTICPGWINTNMNKNLDKEFINKEENKILLGRFGNPNEVAELVFFLVSDNASYINNSIIRIDGGKKC